MLDKLLLPFLGLFFSSTAVLPDGGGMGDDGGGAGGGGDDGGSGEDDGAGVEGDEGGVATDEGEGDDRTGSEGDSEGDDDADGGADSDGEIEGEAGKRQEKDDPLVNALNKLRKVDPKAAQSLRKEHFDNVNFRKVYETPAAAMEAKETLDLVGGPEGIESLKGEADQFATELDMIARGDAQIMEDAFRDSPDGIAKLIPVGIEKLRLHNQQAYNRAVAPAIARAHREFGVRGQVDNVLNLIATGTREQAIAAATKIKEWMDGVEQFAESAKETPLTDREKALQTKEQEINNKGEQNYRSEVGRVANARTSNIISKFLNPFLADRKKAGRPLTLEQKQDVARGIYDEIAKNLKGNTVYQKQMAAHYSKHSTAEDIADYMASKVEAVAKDAVKAVWARKGWAASGGKAKAAPTNGANRTAGRQPVVMLAKQPSDERIDWAKDPQRSRFIGDGKVGEATLVGGKVVRWRW